MKSPFPYFGGKARAAELVWQRFGDVRNYTEPFAGSLAVLLARPQPFDGTETVNDADGFIANFWRATQSDPEAVATHADNPVNENDLHARHAWLVGQRDAMQSRLEGDPEFYDAKIAGWWVWGMACWIGSGFCSGNGPWQVVEEDGVRQLVHLGNAGLGVNRQLVHLGNAGQGVNRKRGEMLAYFGELHDRLRSVRVCCGDWTRICGGKTGDAITLFFASGGKCGIFLDPPYSTEAKRDMTLYRVESGTVAHDVREWALRHGNDERLRIALCGYDGEHAMPRGWRKVPWKAQGGYSNLGTTANGNCRRERIWFSPHCLNSQKSRRGMLAAA